MAGIAWKQGMARNKPAGTCQPAFSDTGGHPFVPISFSA